MKNSKTVLLISISEIYHNPRLIKAADEFHKKGYHVIVNDIILGNVPEETYLKFISSKPWTVNSIDISKRSFRSKLNFYFCSIINVASKLMWRNFRFNFLFEFYLAKGLILFTKKYKPSIIYTNVIDALPFCIKLRNQSKAKFIFDSQELFSGQYQHSERHLKDWILFAEQANLPKADIILATTGIMGRRIKELYPNARTPIRVRNLPNERENIELKKVQNPIQLIWHGYAIYLNSRGIKLLLDGIRLCDAPVILTLQGNVSEEEKSTIKSYLGTAHLHKIDFKPQAPVGKIVNSILGYDVGVIGEQAENENQLYTSSNKLFDYLHAGLPVVTTEMPGIIETINEGVGLSYKNAEEFKTLIEKIAQDDNFYTELRKNAFLFAKNNIWGKDFDHVISKIELL
ncbi:hypothetical protein D3C87_153610 [compost metagenome]